ncbi:FAD-binding oxidoreductase [Nocardioides speluncae]|uniref:FAD-binding oxidoreductase n=1 Tax=Nocardioides speluncae TaxID=2670337 RepID=UPI000D691DBD|nr:FAD-binding oxidoreductase [Nocardioides speluncae]
MTTAAPTESTVTDALVTAVGADAVSTDPRVLDGYRPGKGPFDDLAPGVVVRARSADDVTAVLRIASEHGAPVVVRGGGFSLGGPPAAPGTSPIVLDTRALTRILEIDDATMTVTVECGILMADLHAAVAERGYEVHTVAVPRAHTTLGGVLSGVCGGGFPGDTAEVGGSGQFVLGIQVALPNGTVLDTNAGGSNVHRHVSAIPASDGPGLTQLFIGDGGALGVKLIATIALALARPMVHAGGFEFDELDQALATIEELRRVHEVPYSNLYVVRGPHWSLTYTARASTNQLLAHHVGVVQRAVERHEGRPGNAKLLASARAIAALDPAWADQFMDVDRGAIAGVFDNRTFATSFAELRELVDRRVTEILADLGIEPVVFMSPYGRHAMWFAITLPYNPTVAGARAAARRVTREGYALVAARGGWSEPHQGEVSRLLADAWSPAYRSFVRSLRDHVDPSSVLNQGLWDAPEQVTQQATPRSSERV